MRTPVCVALLSLAAAIPSSQAQIFSDNFNAQVTGNTAAGWTTVSPTTANAFRGMVILDGILPNKFLRAYDTDSTNAARLEQDFLARSDVHLSLNFRRNADIAVDPSAASTTAFYVTIGGNGLAQNQQANRSLEFRLFSNGQYRINRGVQDGSGNFLNTSLTSAQNFEPAGTTFNWHSLDIFMYDNVAGGATLAYQGPDNVSRLLDPNSFSVFIDNVFITPSSNPTANGNFGIFQTTTYATDNNFGRIGLVTGGAGALTGFDYLVDDVVLSAVVPEPGAWTLLGLGSVLFALRRRR